MFWLAAALGASAADLAWAAPKSEFRYLRDEGAASCPSESELRAAVSARLGYDPFEKGAARTIRASIETLAEGFRARVELEGGHEGPAKREIVTQGGCLELVSAIALSISLAIDAERANAAAEASALAASAPTTAPPAPAPSAAASTPPPPPAAPKPAPSERASLTVAEEPPPEQPAPARRPRGPHVPLPLDFALGAHLDLFFGSAPSSAIGGSLFVQGRHGWLSLELGLRLDAPAGREFADGARVQTGVAGFQLAPCAHVHVVKGCVLGLLGEIWATSEGLAVNRSDLAFYSAAGLRLGLEWPRNAAWALSLHGDGMALLKPIQVTIDSQPVWNAPSFYGSFGAGALVRF
jgi:hypothetical protein